MIFVVHGSIMIDGKVLGDGEAWFGKQDAVFAAGDALASKHKAGMKSDFSGKSFDPGEFGKTRATTF